MDKAMEIVETFTGTEPFEAWYKATDWLREHGFSHGSMQGPSPVGVIHGDCDISKWRNLRKRDLAALDGMICAGDKHMGPVRIALTPAGRAAIAGPAAAGGEKEAGK